MREQEQNYLSIFFVFICVLGGRKEQKENKKRIKRVKKKKKYWKFLLDKHWDFNKFVLMIFCHVEQLCQGPKFALVIFSHSMSFRKQKSGRLDKELKHRSFPPLLFIHGSLFVFFFCSPDTQLNKNMILSSLPQRFIKLNSNLS